MIRIALGFIFVLGAVGSIETDPSASLFYYSVVALIGLGLMYWPVADGTFEEYK